MLVKWRRPTQQMSRVLKCFSSSTAEASASNGSTSTLKSIYSIEKIRNFGIIAHVDHGKSTLADRLMQYTNVISKNDKEQYLDKLQVERERGITVKAQTCTMIHKDYMINLIDTPGHIDFSYEVSRSLVACDGVLLLIAANQGIQAQTIANFWLAFNRDLCIIPAINKIDMPNVDVGRLESQLMSIFGFNQADILRISAKTGHNVPAVIDAIVERLPPPSADRQAPFSAIIFDSWFDHFRGGIALVLIKSGVVALGMRIRSLNGGREYEVAEVGFMHPEMVLAERLYAGQVGYLICHMKTVREAIVGEVLYDATAADDNPPPATTGAGFKPSTPTIYAGLYPVEPADYENLRRALERLCLNDASVTLEPSVSPAMGAGWRVGFLGALHMEVFGQRLDQEYDANVIITALGVEYRADLVDNETIRRKRHNGQSSIRISNAAQFPEFPTDVRAFYEPMVLLTVVTPNDHVGAVAELCRRIRGEERECVSIDESRLMSKWRVPMADVIGGFFEDLKRATSGYASFDYEDDGYREIELVKITICINKTVVEEFSHICPKSGAHQKAKELVEKLKNEIPRQQYEVMIGAHFGTSAKPFVYVIIKAYRKDFTGTLKGNMVKSRLDKKVRDQERGKERMKAIGNVKIPKEAFLNFMKR